MPKTCTAQEVECAEQGLLREICYLQHTLYRLYVPGLPADAKMLEVSRLLDAALLRYQAAFPSNVRDVFASFQYR